MPVVRKAMRSWLEGLGGSTLSTGASLRRESGAGKAPRAGKAPHRAGPAATAGDGALPCCEPALLGHASELVVEQRQRAEQALAGVRR